MDTMGGMDASVVVEYLRRLDERRQSLAAEIEDDVAPYRGLSADERGRILESVCRDAWAILSSRPDYAPSGAAW